MTAMDTPKTSRTHLPRSMSTNVSNANASISSIPTPSRSFSNGNTSGTGTGIPAFRSLRSLLPFGPGKSTSTPAKAEMSNASFSSPSASLSTSKPLAISTSSSSSLSKGTGHAHSQSFSQGSSLGGTTSKFSAFGTVRRSMTKERGKAGELEDKGRPSASFLRKGVPMNPTATAVKGGGSSKEDTFEDVIAIVPDAESSSNLPIRRSASFPRIEKEVIEQDSHDLSTIIEAETSGISKHLPDINTSPTSSPSHSPKRSNSLLPPSLARTKSDSLIRPSSYLTTAHSASSSSAALADTVSSPSASSPQSPYTTDQELDVSTSQVQGQVLDALLVTDYAAAREWLNSDDAVVVDDEEIDTGGVDVDLTQKVGPPANYREADASKFNLGDFLTHIDGEGRLATELGPLDPELAALLSPHRLSGSSSPKRHSSPSQRSSLQLTSRRSSQRISGNITATPSPIQPTFDSGRTASHPTTSHVASSLPIESTVFERKIPPSSLPKPLSSSLPRLRTHATPPQSPSAIPTTASSHSSPNPTPSSAAPAARPSPLASSTIFPPPPRQSSPERRLQYQPTPPSPLREESVRVFDGDQGRQRAEHGAHADGQPQSEGDRPQVPPESTEAQRIQLEYQARTKPSALLPRLVTPLRQSRRDQPSNDDDQYHANDEFSQTPESRHGQLHPPSRPPLRQMFTSSSSPGLVPPTLSRSNRPSPASSVVGDANGLNVSPATTMDETPARSRPSLDESRLEHSSTRTATGRRGLTYIHAKSRARKRSMSVEGSPGFNISGSPSEFGVLSTDDTTLGGLRSSSSLSNRRDNATTRPDWLGPRAAKALAAAGLLNLDQDRDYELERERERERDRRLDLAGFRSVTPTMGSSSRAATPNYGGSASGLVRYGSQRGGGGGSDFRAQSRMAFSESGAGGGIISARKGSGSYSAVNSQYNTPSSSNGNSSSYGSGSGTRYSGRERGGSVSVSATGSAVSPLMESPTFTESVRGRGTPLSVSTAPTSVLSGTSERERERGRGFAGERDKERERLEVEMDRMRDKHSLEMGALLSALSDSQRTSKMLREENAGLRDRLESALREVHVLRTRCDEWKWEAETLREAMATGEVTHSPAKSPSRWRSLRGLGHEAGGRESETVGGSGRPKALGLGLPSVLQRHRERLGPGPSAPPRRSYEYRARAASASVAAPIQDVSADDVPFSSRQHLAPSSAKLLPFNAAASLQPPLSSTPAAKGKGHRRRSSTTSSVFPNVPANMSMLMNDPPDDPDFAALASFSMTLSRPASFNTSAPRQIPSSKASRSTTQQSHKKAVSSVCNISPTTANFSISEVTGSPESLHLRPEDEMHLQDMDIMSLNLVRASEDGDSDAE